MMCYQEDCDDKAEVAYENHEENTVTVVGYCENHDPHPDQPFDKPFDPDKIDTDQ